MNSRAVFKSGCEHNMVRPGSDSSQNVDTSIRAGASDGYQLPDAARYNIFCGKCMQDENKTGATP